MEGKRSSFSSKPSDLLRRIRELTLSILTNLSNGQSPVVQIDRFRNYCTETSGNCYCNCVISIGKERLTLQREAQTRRLDVLLRVLLMVQTLLQENRHGSKRDIYYMHPTVFKDQCVVDRAINDICILLQCSRHNLNVVSVGKGLVTSSEYSQVLSQNHRMVMGWLKFSEAGRKFDCINSPNAAYPIPVHVEDVEIFQRLANDLFCTRNHCIVITGRGYPDVPTRRFLRLLIEKLHLPAYCLVDCDPYGFDILTTYRFGSMQMAYDTKFLSIPEIRWLGVFPSEVEKYCLPKHCLLPLTRQDKIKVEAMLLRCYLQRDAPQWRFELDLMVARGLKFEIEALSVQSLPFLSEEYLPSKIQGEFYI